MRSTPLTDHFEKLTGKHADQRAGALSVLAAHARQLMFSLLTPAAPLAESLASGHGHSQRCIAVLQILVLAWAENRKDLEVVWKLLSQVPDKAFGSLPIPRTPQEVRG